MLPKHFLDSGEAYFLQVLDVGFPVRAPGLGADLVAVTQLLDSRKHCKNAHCCGACASLARISRTALLIFTCTGTEHSLYKDCLKEG